jgi:hypothetical protein
MTKKIAAATAVAALALPAVAGTGSAQANPIPPCYQAVLANAPGFVVNTATNFVENGELPRLMGPFFPC